MKKALLLALSVFLFWNVTEAGAATLLNSSTFKMTIVRNGVEYEWEYNNPDEFEYEYGSRVIKGEKAQQSVTEMFKLLQVSPHMKVEKMMKALEEYGYHDIDHLDVRWTNSDEKLFTWVWDKKDK